MPFIAGPVLLVSILAAELLAAGEGETGGGTGSMNTSVLGRARADGETLLLDGTQSESRLLRFDAAGALRSSFALERSPVALDGTGLAVSADGLLWTLGDKGKTMVAFEPGHGRVADLRPLPERFQTIWSIEGVVMLATGRSEHDSPFLFVMTQDGLKACGALRAPPGDGPLDASLLAMFACGGSRTAVLPCWWVAGSPTVVFLRSSCASKSVAVPAAVTPRTAAERGSDPADRFDYPIRDAFSIDEHSLWILTNQEGKDSPLSAPEKIARHLLLVRDGRLERTINLPRKGRLILGGDDREVSVLFSDGSTARMGPK